MPHQSSLTSPSHSLLLHRLGRPRPSLTMLLVFCALLLVLVLPTRAASSATLLYTFGYSDPNYSGSSPNSFVNVGGTLFFVADDGIHGLELWKSDGTPAGTMLVKDSIPGVYGSAPRELVNVNGTLFFSAYDTVSQRNSIWKSNGTEAGTTVVHAFGSVASPDYLRSANGLLYFIVPPDEASGGLEVWRTDGTDAGTLRLGDYYGSSTQPGSPDTFLAVGGRLFFTVESNADIELWKSDGTADTTTMISPLPAEAGHFTSVNSTLFFTVSSFGIWKSDGTAAGTGTMLVTNDNLPTNLTNVNNVLFFATGNTLWKSDGTAADTVAVKTGFMNDISNIIAVDTTAFLTFNYNSELWKSDGTGAGTVMVKSFDPYSGKIVAPMALARKLFFIASSVDAVTDGVWQSDGTEAGTIQLQNATNLSDLSQAGGNLFFLGSLSDGNPQLYSLPVTTEPSLMINFTTGKPGSFFSVSGADYAPNQSLDVIVNGHVLDSVSTDSSGTAAFVLATSSDADLGNYTMTLDARVTAPFVTSPPIAFTLDEAAPLRTQSGNGLTVTMSHGLIYTRTIYLPVVNH